MKTTYECIHLDSTEEREVRCRGQSWTEQTTQDSFRGALAVLRAIKRNENAARGLGAMLRRQSAPSRLASLVQGRDLFERSYGRDVEALALRYEK